VTKSRFVVNLPDGRAAYYLPSDTYASGGLVDLGADVPKGVWGSISWTLPDGTPLEPLQHRWHAAPGRVNTLHATIAGRREVVRYELHHPEAASARYPATLDIGDYELRTDDHVADTYDAAVVGLYRPVTEETAPAVVPVDVSSWLDLDGEMPEPPPGCTWTATLPSELSTRAEYRHLFPGELTGYQNGIANAVKARWPHVDTSWYSHEPGQIKISVRRPYQPVLMRPVQERDRRGRRKVTQKPDEHTWYFKVDLGRAIKAPNLADAVAYLGTLTAEILDAVGQVVEQTPCGHCRGTGLVPPAVGGRVRERKL